MKKTHVFEANDGETFSSAADCRKYEDEALVRKVASLSLDQVTDAISGKNPKLAAAFERIGNMIASKRRESGDLRRTKKQAAK